VGVVVFGLRWVGVLGGGDGDRQQKSENEYRIFHARSPTQLEMISAMIRVEGHVSGGKRDRSQSSRERPMLRTMEVAMGK